MGLFDVMGKLGSGGKEGLMSGIMNLVNDPNSGGLSGLVEQFKSKGLGDLVNSWVSTGQNLPITPDQIQHGLGEDTIQKLSEQAGVEPEKLKEMLATHLPHVVDKLTPEGEVPEGDIGSKAMNLLGNLFK